MKPSQLLAQTKVKQGFNDLNSEPNVFCALGAIAHEIGWKGWYKKDGGYRKRAGDAHNYLQKIGIDDVMEDEIVELNDDKKWTFKKISKWLAERGL